MSHDIPAPSPNMLVARKLVKTYSPSRSRAAERGGVRTSALRGLDLRVARGEFVAVTGPSGSGKSTLLHLMAGLERPDSGSIWLEGRRIDELSETRRAALRRHHIGVVFQFFNLVSTLTAADNIELAGLLAGRSARQVRARRRELLDELGLTGKEDSTPRDLAGGEQQRVALARALVNTPALLLADEPTGSLDSHGTREVLRLLSRYHARGQTIVMVTHDANVASVADRVVNIFDGEIADEIVFDDRPLGPTAAGSVVRLMD
jgi:putative ABC transport system ATP-binding protein